MFRPHKIKWSDYRSKIVPDAKKQPIRHSQMERLLGVGIISKCVSKAFTQLDGPWEQNRIAVDGPW